MQWLGEMWRRIVFLARRRRFEDDFDEQMRFHLEMEAEANRDAGMDRDEARYAAMRTVGNPVALRERSLDQWGWRPVDDVLHDVRYGWRSMRRSPGFVAVALASLALGIGVNLGVFEFADALFLKPFPGVSDSARLASVYHYTARGGYDSSSYPDYAYYRGHNRAFTSLAAYSTWGMVVRAGDAIDEVDGELVSPEYFATLGLAPAAGRLLTPDDARPGADAAVVLSYRYWTRRFGADPAAIGRSIHVGQASATVVGVAARGFEGLSAENSPALWASATHYRLTVPVLATSQDDPRDDLLTSWGNRSFGLVGRLRPGWTFDGAARDMSVAARRVVSDHPERAARIGGDRAPGIIVLPAVASRFWPGYQREAVGLLRLLAGVALLILLIACLNVSSLVLARTTRRRHELALRLSLGAGRARLARQLLTENLSITVPGAALSLVVANWTVDLLSQTGVRLGSASVLAVQGAVDWRVVAAAAGLALLTACALTLLPLRLLRSPQNAGVLDGGSRTGGGRRTGAQNALVCLQIALSVVLVTTAGLFVRTLQNARAVNTTVSPERLLLGKVDLTGPAYADAPVRTALFGALIDRVRAIPGVRDAGVVFVVPHGGRRGGTQIEFESADGRRAERQVGFNVVSPRYFRTTGVPLVAGRNLSDHDAAGAPGVAVVNEVMASRLFPGRNPIGRRILLKWPPAAMVEIVGVVQDGGKWRYRAEGEPIVYLPVAQRPMRQMTLEVRTSGDPEVLVPAIRRECAALGSDLNLTDVQTAQAYFDSTLARERMVATLLTVLAAIALLLAAIGVFGVLSYAVAQQTREIGVRLAVGATPRMIVNGVLARTVRLTSTGLAAGTLGALGLGRTVRGLLFGVGPADPLVLASTLLVLMGVALAAGYLPARRAARVDPVAAIRTE